MKETLVMCSIWLGICVGTFLLISIPIWLVGAAWKAHNCHKIANNMGVDSKYLFPQGVCLIQMDNGKYINIDNYHGVNQQ